MLCTFLPIASISFLLPDQFFRKLRETYDLFLYCRPALHLFSFFPNRLSAQRLSVLVAQYNVLLRPIRWQDLLLHSKNLQYNFLWLSVFENESDNSVKKDTKAFFPTVSYFFEALLHGLYLLLYIFSYSYFYFIVRRLGVSLPPSSPSGLPPPSSEGGKKWEDAARSHHFAGRQGVVAVSRSSMIIPHPTAHPRPPPGA